jgi:hypothetical protein
MDYRDDTPQAGLTSGNSRCPNQIESAHANQTAAGCLGAQRYGQKIFVNEVDLQATAKIY